MLALNEVVEEQVVAFLPTAELKRFYSDVAMNVAFVVEGVDQLNHLNAKHAH